MVRRGQPPRGPVEVVAVEQELDRLFQQPIAQFVAARNALTTRLRSAGRRDDADTVRALARPSASAWAINQVYWSAREDYDRLVEAGDRLREAQQSGLRGRASDLPSAMLARQRAVDAVVERAAGFLRASGAPPSEATRRRLAVTCDAIAAHGTLSSRPRPGRLSQDLDPPGLSLLASLAPVPGAPPPSRGAAVRQTAASPASAGRTTPARRPASGETAAQREDDDHAKQRATSEAQARAEFEAARAEAEVKRRRLEVARASREAEAAAGRAALARNDVEAARARLQTADRRARESGDALEAARRRAAEAEAALQSAEAAANEARGRLTRLARNR